MGLRLGYMVPEFPNQTHIFFWREIEALRRMGEQVFIVSTRRPTPPICHHDFARVALAETHYLYPPRFPNLFLGTASNLRGLSRAHRYIKGLDTHNFASRCHHYGLLISAIDLMMWARQSRVDHIHGHSCANSAHVLALSRCMGGPPYSLTLHGDLSVYGTDHRSKMIGAEFICVMGNHLRRQVVEQAGIPQDRLFVSCMGLRTSELKNMAENRAYNRDEFHLITVARLNRAKGHFHALAAIHQAKKAGLNVRYTIAGEGLYRERITARINELGLESQVTLVGTLSEVEVFKLLSRADAFVLPSTGIGEAWPVSVMEAMSAGLPVISSIIGATPEMISNGKDGFLVPQAAENSLFDLIALLAQDVDLRRRIGTEARSTARHRFDVDVTAQALRDAIYESRRRYEGAR
jgi:colanic acid/amylovoran biosynthesis glycosyltransferase